MGKILVLGGNGFVGSNFLNRFSTSKDQEFSDVISLDLILPALYADKVKYDQCDITDRDALQKMLFKYKPKYLINFAGILRADNLDDILRINLMPSNTVMEFAAQNGYPEKILLVGSAAEYGIPKSNPVTEDDLLCPINLYGISKMFQTQLAQYYFRERNVGVMVARTFNLMGMGVSTSLAIGNWMKQIDVLEEGQTIRVGNLESQRDYLHVNEALVKYLYLLKYGKLGEVYNICSGKPIKMLAVLESLIRESGKNLKIETVKELLKRDEIPMIYGDSRKFDSI